MASPNRADRPGASAAQALFARNNPSLSSLSSSSAARNQHQSQNPHLYPHQVFRYPRAHILQPLSSYSPIPRAAITPTAPVVWNPVAPKNPYYPGTFAPTSPTRPVEPRPAFSLSLYLPRDAGDTTLIRAGYTPCYTPDRERSNSAEGLGKAPGGKKGGKRSKMAEPRARAARHKGQMNFPSECTWETAHRAVLLPTNRLPLEQYAYSSLPTVTRVHILRSLRNLFLKQFACLMRL